MTKTDKKSSLGNRAKIKLGEKLVIGHLKQTFRRYFRTDLSFYYPDLGRQGNIMYSNCSLDFQRLHMEAIGKKDYVASMVLAEEDEPKFSPWSSGAGFYVSRYSDFAALWSWVADPENSLCKNLECQGWHAELTEPVVEYARSIGKLEEKLKHSGEVLSKMRVSRGQHSRNDKVVELKLPA